MKTEISYIQNLLTNMNILTICKTFLAFALAYILPIQTLALLIITVVLLDTFFGTFVSLKKGEDFSFKKFFLFGLKLLTYLVILLICFFIDKALFDGILPILLIPFGISKAWTLFIVYDRFSSIDENNQKLGAKSFYSRLTSMLDKIKEIKDKIMAIKKDE